MEHRFATRVTAPDGRSWPKVRVAVAGEWLAVFEPDQTGRPSMVAAALLAGEPQTVAGRWYLPTAAGNWQADGPCGCASPPSR